MSDLIYHLETQLGPIVSGWIRDAEGQKLPFQVVLFERGPIQDTCVITTLGLSDISLQIGETNKEIRQELIMLSRKEMGYRNLPGILQQAGLWAYHNKKAYSIGQVIGPHGPLFRGSSVEALYVARPVYFPDEFHVFHSRFGSPIVFAWLVPITSLEAGFIKTHGHAAFEEQLEKHDPDLLDFHRASIIL